MLPKIISYQIIWIGTVARADAHHTTNLLSLIRDSFVRAPFEAAEWDVLHPLLC